MYQQIFEMTVNISKKFCPYWDEGHTGLINISRGHFYKNGTLQHSAAKVNATVKNVVFPSTLQIYNLGLSWWNLTSWFNSRNQDQESKCWWAINIPRKISKLYNLSCKWWWFWCLVVPCWRKVWEFSLDQKTVLIYVMMDLCNFILGDSIIDLWFHDISDSKA